MTVKRQMLVCIMIVLSALLLSSCTGDQTGLAGSWKADNPSEYDLQGKDELRSVTYHLSRPWFNEGNLAIEYEYTDTTKRQWDDVGFYSVNGDRIDLFGPGSYTIADGVLTISYDDGTVRTFTRTR